MPWGKVKSWLFTGSSPFAFLILANDIVRRIIYAQRERENQEVPSFIDAFGRRSPSANGGALCESLPAIGGNSRNFCEAGLVIG